MKKLFFLILAGAFMIAQPLTINAQEESAENATEQQDETDADEAPAAAQDAESATDVEEVEEQDKVTTTQFIKEKFIEGDPRFMSLVLLTLILGLAIAIERIITIFLSSINTKKFVDDIEKTLISEGVEAAKEKCRNTRGPIASIFYQGLDRVDEGIDNVEKAVVSYGSVKVGELEKGLVWISLFIALAPMLGFMGTVIGMIFAFDDIEREGDISPALVARGIKLALLTTVAGLIVAIILQIFYNLIMSKIDSISNEMEDASISLVDILIKNKLTQNNA
jgi:biopolymer transport protein ExbB